MLRNAWASATVALALIGVESGGEVAEMQTVGFDGELSGRSEESGYRVRGTAAILGTGGRFFLDVHADGGLCYVVEAELGEGLEWDGARARSVDMTGVARTIHDHERWLALVEWWIFTGAWQGDELPGQVVHDSASNGGDVYRLVMGDVTARLWTGANGKPVRLERRGAAGLDVTRFEQWRTIDGRNLPAVVVSTIEGFEYRRLDVEVVEPLDETRRCSLDRAPEASFDSHRTPRVEVRRAPTGHMLLRPMVDGADRGWFILDTGGGPGVLDERLVAVLGLRPVGRGAMASYAGTQAADWYRVREVEVGPVRLGDVPMIGMDLAFLDEPLDAQIAGILGYGLLSRVVAEVETATPSLSLWDPAAYRVSDPGSWRPLKLIDLVPTAKGHFPEGTGDFRLDIGAGGPAGGVVFHAPAVDRLGLVGALRTLSADGPAAAGDGAAQLPAVSARLAWFEIGGHRRSEVSALLWTGHEGAFVDPYLTGNVGLEVLDHFVLVLDYPRERFRLEPRVPSE